ncbi:AbiTii domain-containing protein [Kribbella endophytica]
MTNNPSLLAQIQADALDSAKSLADTLRKCIALGGETGSTELRDWARQELEGYVGPGDEVPGYRIVRAPLQLDAIVGTNQIKGQPISPNDLPEVVVGQIDELVHLSGGVGELEAMAQQAKERGLKLTPAQGMDVVNLMNQENDQPFQQITHLYWHLSASPIVGVLDKIRTILTSLVAEMRAMTGPDEDLPSAKTADQAVNVVVRGNKRSVVNVHTAQGSSGGEASATPPTPSTEERSGFWTKWRKVGAGAVAIIGAVAGVGEWQNWNPF